MQRINKYQCMGDDGTLVKALRKGHEIMVRPRGGQILYVHPKLWCAYAGLPVPE